MLLYPSPPVKYMFILWLMPFITAVSCDNQPVRIPAVKLKSPVLADTVADSPAVRNSIHVFTALCDNKYQGIVPVPAIMGNGQDPGNNLYWGWGFGIRTYFNRSKEWVLVSSGKPGYPVLERLVYKHRSLDWHLVADAYDGRAMKECLTNYLKAASGISKGIIISDSTVIGVNGNARLLAFVGHDGLMDLQLEELYKHADNKTRDCIVLACYSKQFFGSRLKDAGARPLLWTTNLFGPEAYTLHDALSGYIRGESDKAIQTRAAEVYAKYTKCSVKAAKNLLVSGW